MQEQKEWHVVELLRTTTVFFEKKQVTEPRISSELLLGYVLGQTRLQLYLHHNRPVYRIYRRFSEQLKGIKAV